MEYIYIYIRLDWKAVCRLHGVCIVEYIIWGIHYGRCTPHYRLPSQTYLNRSWPNAIQQTWAGLAWPGQISTPGKSKKLRVSRIKIGGPTKRLATLRAPSMTLHVTQQHFQMSKLSKSQISTPASPHKLRVGQDQTTASNQTLLGIRI